MEREGRRGGETDATQIIPGIRMNAANLWCGRMDVSTLNTASPRKYTYTYPLVHTLWGYLRVLENNVFKFIFWNFYSFNLKDKCYFVCVCVLFYVYMYRESIHAYMYIYIACIPRHEEVTELQGSSSAVLYLILSLNLEFAFQLAVQESPRICLSPPQCWSYSAYLHPALHRCPEAKFRSLC